MTLMEYLWQWVVSEWERWSVSAENRVNKPRAAPVVKLKPVGQIFLGGDFRGMSDADHIAIYTGAQWNAIND